MWYYDVYKVFLLLFFGISCHVLRSHQFPSSSMSVLHPCSLPSQRKLKNKNLIYKTKQKTLLAMACSSVTHRVLSHVPFRPIPQCMCHFAPAFLPLHHIVLHCNAIGSCGESHSSSSSFACKCSLQRALGLLQSLWLMLPHQYWTLLESSFCFLAAAPGHGDPAVMVPTALQCLVAAGEGQSQLCG